MGDAAIWVAAFAFLGTLVTQILAFLSNRGKVKGVDEKVDRIHEEVKSGNGQPTGQTVDKLDHKFDRFSERFEERLDNLEQSVLEIQEDTAVETASWATIFAAHISDGHDPTGQWTRIEPPSHTRRSTDRKKSDD